MGMQSMPHHRDRRWLLGVVLLAFVSQPVAATVIPPGPVSGTWGLAGSPYEIQGDIHVPAGSDLVIEPGVQVIFAGPFRLTIEGTLHAIGTESQPIEIGGSVQWSGLRFEHPDLMSQLHHCAITGAVQGVGSVNAPLELAHCELSHHGTAVHIYGIGDPDPAPVTVSECAISECQQHGIFVVENSNTLITGCDVSACALDGSPRGAIQLSNQSTQGRNDPTITANWIHDNTWQGLTAFDVTGLGRIAPTVTGNTIEYNYTGVYLLYASGTLRDNQINHNFQEGNPDSGAGVMVYGATARPVLTGNTTTGNFTGYYVVAGAAPNLGDLGSVSPDDDGGNWIYDNVDPAGNLWSVYSNSTADIAAENNRWDSEDYGEIAETIYDGNDNPVCGIVDFDPILPMATTGEHAAEEWLGRVRVDSWGPSPFAEVTRVRFEVAAATSGEDVRLDVLAADGRFVVCLMRGRPGPGPHLCEWNGCDARGKPMGSGVYWLCLESGVQQVVRRVVLQR